MSVIEAIEQSEMGEGIEWVCISSRVRWEK
jgi:hypothetical protein